MPMPRRPVEPVLNLPARVPPGSERDTFDKSTAGYGKSVSLDQVPLLLETAGYTVTNAATAPGTAITVARTVIDFADAGVDNVRLVVRGKNSAAGDVSVQVYDVTNSVLLAIAPISGTTEQTSVGSWTRIVPTGTDQEVEVRVVGDGAFDPILYAVHLQLRTVQTRV